MVKRTRNPDVAAMAAKRKTTPHPSPLPLRGEGVFDMFAER